jgi:hypothetical protein
MDPRCDGHKCDVHSDAFGQWWEVDGLKTTLDYMSIATTETDAALAYDIHLAFGPRQPLDRDSTLGKALQAKYGDSTSVEEGANNDKVGGGRMLWWNSEIGSNGPNVIVECNGTNGEGPQCTLSAGDNGTFEAGRHRREAKKSRAAEDRASFIEFAALSRNGGQSRRRSAEVLRCSASRDGARRRREAALNASFLGKT